MIGRSDTKLGPCPDCFVNGVNSKNRKRKCALCYGQKHVQWCVTCDTPLPCTGTKDVLDQIFCERKSKC